MIKRPMPTPTASRSLRPLAAILLLSILHSACEQPPADLVPRARLVEHIAKALNHPALVERGYATIDGVTRPTLEASRPWPADLDCAPVSNAPSELRCSVGLAHPRHRAPWILGRVQSAGHDDPGSPKTRGKRKEEILLWPSAALLAGKATIQIPERGSAVSLIGMPTLDRRAISSSKLRLPAGSVLRGWFGVEEPAWIPGTAPVAFAIHVDHPDERRTEKVFHHVLDPARETADRGWHPFEVTLPIRGDHETLRLRFTARRGTKGETSSSLPVWADPTVLSPGDQRRQPRRIVLISLDTLRARSMSAYGYRHVSTTPFFEQLAEEGTLFENAFTTFSNTLGAHLSMMTGLYPGTHLLFQGGTEDASAPALLAESLRRAGYDTAGFTENALLRGSIFRRGFSTYHENTEIRAGAGDAEGTFERALDWARRHHDRPFFLFIHTYEVHAPYGEDEFTAADLASLEIADPAYGKALQDDYEKEIVHVDDLLRELVAGLDELGNPDELLLIVTADHGEEFLEHGGLLHGTLFDEVMHIPLLMRWPGVVTSNTRIEAPVSLVDVVPTVLELAGAPATSVEGISLVPLIEGADIARSAVFGQSPAHLRGRDARIVGRSADAKCFVNATDDTAECFDLRTDAKEAHPLAPDTRPDLATLHEQVVAHRARMRSRLGGRALDTKIRPEDEVDPARREKLRALGYVE